MTTDPPTMRAIIQDSYGAPGHVLRLDQTVRPSVGADDVLIRVRATSVNTPDWATVAGVPYALRLQSGLRRPSHQVRGSDVAGVVETVGPRVTDLRPGDEVLGSLWGSAVGSRAGAFAQYTVAPASPLVRKPAGLSPPCQFRIVPQHLPQHWQSLRKRPTCPHHHCHHPDQHVRIQSGQQLRGCVDGLQRCPCDRRACRIAGRSMPP